MKTLNLMILMIALIPHSALYAAGDKGNGGDVVYCNTSNGPNAELLDVYEARVLRNIDLDLGGVNLNMRSKVELVLGRLQTYSIEAYEYSLNRFMEFLFLSNAQFVQGVELIDIPDSEHIILPKNCQVRQIVIQQKPKFKEDKKYIINKELWDLLDDDNKVALMTHEIFYEKALETLVPLEEPVIVNVPFPVFSTSGTGRLVPLVKDSRGVRYFNSYVFSGKITDLSFKEALELGETTEIKFAPSHYFELTLSKILNNPIVNLTESSDFFLMAFGISDQKLIRLEASQNSSPLDHWLTKLNPSHIEVFNKNGEIYLLQNKIQISGKLSLKNSQSMTVKNINNILFLNQGEFVRFPEVGGSGQGEVSEAQLLAHFYIGNERKEILLTENGAPTHRFCRTSDPGVCINSLPIYAESGHVLQIKESFFRVSFGFEVKNFSISQFKDIPVKAFNFRWDTVKKSTQVSHVQAGITKTYPIQIGDTPVLVTVLQNELVSVNEQGEITSFKIADYSKKPVLCEGATTSVILYKNYSVTLGKTGLIQSVIDSNGKSVNCKTKP